MWGLWLRVPSTGVIYLASLIALAWVVSTVFRATSQNLASAEGDRLSSCPAPQDDDKDTQRYLGAVRGLTVAEAEAIFPEDSFRVVADDGAPLIVAMELIVGRCAHQNRVNIALERGRITKVVSLG